MNELEKAVRERASEYFKRSRNIKTVKINTLDNKPMICECGKKDYKLYRKFGGVTRGKYNRVMNSVPVTHNYVCQCGRRLILKEGTFKFAKTKYGCSAGKCPFGKAKMDKGCLSCQYIYEK